MPSYTIVTGATGLLGRYLLRDLLLEDGRLAVVARSRKKFAASERIESILQFWERELGTSLPRPVCLEGDVTKPWLGLGGSARRWLSRHCDRMLHNAATLQFHTDEQTGEPWRTNVEGTRHAVEVCERLGIREMHYVSTAYVCGKRSGLIKESEFDLGQQFRNDYERSKFLAERIVRQSAAVKRLNRVTIYRPTVIAGDSRTGYTSTYHGLYMYLRLMTVINRNTEPGPDGVRYTPVRLCMTGDERRNIVPVDWVSACVCRLLATPDAHGRTFHLAPTQPLTPREIIECGYRYFNSRGVEFVGYGGQPDSPGSDIERASQENMAIYEPYERDDPEFDMTELQRFAGDEPCPRIDEAMLTRFWRFGESDRWGKRPVPRADVPFSVGDYLDSVLPTLLETKVEPSATCGPVVGLDASGPGGGQWHLVVRDANVLDFAAGLPEGDVPILRFGADEVAALARGNEPSFTESLDRCQTAGSLGNGELLSHIAQALFPGMSVSLA